MAKFDKIAVLNKMASAPMVPVFYHKDASTAKRVVKACYDGGVRLFEFTNRGDFAHEVFAEGWKPRGVPYVPGCGSVSEVGFAQEAGCEVCKLFPGDVLGPKMVKGLMAPMPWSKIMVTGGVEPTEENLNSWFKAGAFAVGMGSKLFPKDVVAAGDWQFIQDKCAECFSIINNK